MAFPLLFRRYWRQECDASSALTVPVLLQPRYSLTSVLPGARSMRSQGRPPLRRQVKTEIGRFPSPFEPDPASTGGGRDGERKPPPDFPKSTIRKEGPP